MTNGNGNGITKPITETVRALANAPMLLVLVLLNVIFMGMITYLLKARADTMLQERSEMLKILDGCMHKLNRDGP